MRYKVLLRHPMFSGVCIFNGPVNKFEFHHVADVEVSDDVGLEGVYLITQNGSPEHDPLNNPTGTWTKDSRVTLTEEGKRLGCEVMNDSLRSLSVGDIVADDDNLWMVFAYGFLKVKERVSDYEVVD